MRVYVIRKFDRWRRKEAISDEILRKAVEEIKSGLIDANLGGGLYKKRLAGLGKAREVRTGHSWYPNRGHAYFSFMDFGRTNKTI